MGEGEGIRVSDAERQAVADVLREQASAGRLTLAEFEERLDEVYGSKTDQDLRAALRELPVEPPAPLVNRGPAADEVTDADLRERYRVRMRKELSGFVVPNFLCNVIWYLGDHGYWWPGWVLAATGAGLLGTIISGFDREKERARLVAERRALAMDDIERKFRKVRGD
jgi:hypothetical protein